MQKDELADIESEHRAWLIAQLEARAEGLIAALEKIEVMDTDYTRGPDHNLEIARDIAAKALTAYRSARP